MGCDNNGLYAITFQSGAAPRGGRGAMVTPKTMCDFPDVE